MQNPYSMYNSETGYVELYEDCVVVGIPDPFTSVAFGKLTVGDKIKNVTISGSKEISCNITRQYHLLDVLISARIGDVLTITVERNGALVDANILVTEDCLLAC